MYTHACRLHISAEAYFRFAGFLVTFSSLLLQAEAIFWRTAPPDYHGALAWVNPYSVASSTQVLQSPVPAPRLWADLGAGFLQANGAPPSSQVTSLLTSNSVSALR